MDALGALVTGLFALLLTTVLGWLLGLDALPTRLSALLVVGALLYASFLAFRYVRDVLSRSPTGACGKRAPRPQGSARGRLLDDQHLIRLDLLQRLHRTARPPNLQIHVRRGPHSEMEAPVVGRVEP